MSIVADIEEVATTDAAPSVAPFKVSAKAAKDTLTFKVKVTAAGVIRAIRVRFKPTNRNTGKLLYSRGMVCGTGDRCGSATARSLAQTSPFTTATVTVTESAIAAEPDGEYTVGAYACAETDGWST